MSPPSSDSRVLRYATAPDRPWRNGLGTARDLHEGDGWTLGVATIAAAAEFSAYPGLDRTFVVADGEVELTVDGTHTRLRRGALATFPGEAVVSAVPSAGRAHAVNVMTRRGSAVAVVHVEHLTGASPAATALVLLAGAARAGGQELSPLDAVLPAPAGAADCHDALAVLVRIEPSPIEPRLQEGPT